MVKPQTTLVESLDHYHSLERVDYSARRETIQSIVNETFLVDVCYEAHEPAYAYNTDQRFRNGQSLKGVIAGTSHKVTVQLPRERNDEINACAKDDVVQVVLSPIKWEGVYDRLSCLAVLDVEPVVGAETSDEVDGVEPDDRDPQGEDTNTTTVDDSDVEPVVVAEAIEEVDGIESGDSVVVVDAIRKDLHLEVEPDVKAETQDDDGSAEDIVPGIESRKKMGIGSETIVTTSRMAVASMVLGLLSVGCCMFTGIPAIILGTIALIQISRSNGRLKGTGYAVTGLVCGIMFTIITLVGAILVPAVGSARDAVWRANQMKQLNLALLKYHQATEHFPAHAIYSDDGKPLLSWRVAILPYIEQQALHARFHLDEPWDSEHNRALIPEMPALLLDPSSKLALEQGKTRYVGPVGKGLVFNGTDRGISLTDDTATIITLLQVNDPHAVIWTKPKDWTYDEKEPLHGLDGNFLSGGFLVSDLFSVTCRSPGDLPFVFFVSLDVLHRTGTMVDEPQVPPVARRAIRTRSVNHVRVMDEHITGFHFDSHLRIGRRIGWTGQSATGTQHARRHVREDLENMRTTQAGDRATLGRLIVECQRRDQSPRRGKEHVGVVLVIRELVARVRWLVDVLDSTGNRFVVEQCPRQVAQQRRIEQVPQIVRAILDMEYAPHR